jgi:cold-inducible RNA-binding protein
MGKKLFVGNLSYDTTSEDLKDLFSQKGTCESASVITDRTTGRSRGFGFVEMASQSEAERAMSELNGHELQGRKLTVSEARERTGGGGGGGGRRDFGGGGGGGRGGFGGGRGGPRSRY